MLSQAIGDKTLPHVNRRGFLPSMPDNVDTLKVIEMRVLEVYIEKRAPLIFHTLVPIELHYRFSHRLAL